MNNRLKPLPANVADLTVANGAAPGPQCGSCKHWHARPSDPMNIGQVKQGECRQGPPHATILHPQTGAIGVTYPVLPQNFAACSQHEGKVQVEAA